MYARKTICLLFCVCSIQLCSSRIHAQSPHADKAKADPNVKEGVNSNKSTFFFTIRFGQGGFRDKRSSINQLGGGQLAFDVRHRKYPIALSISSEYYTNSSNPTHHYEISGLTAVNILYIPWDSENRRYDIFFGGGIGQLKVPKSEENPDETEKGLLFNLEASINYTLFWKLGLYGTGKYLYSQKRVDEIRIINFNELIVLIGITFNFCI